MHVYIKIYFANLVTLESQSIFIRENITNITNSIFTFQNLRTNKNEQPIL